MELPVSLFSSLRVAPQRIDDVRHTVGVAHLDLLSPASDNSSIATPSIKQTLVPSADSTLSWSTPTAQPVLAAPEPVPITLNQIATPAQEYAPDLPLDVIVGAAIDPAPYHEPSLPAPALSRSEIDKALRLPSFDILGIASPHPDHIRDWTLANASFRSVGCGADGQISPDGDSPSTNVPDVDDPALHSEHVVPNSDQSFSYDSPKSFPKVSRHQFVTTLTPPADHGGSLWESVATLGLEATPMDTPRNDSASAARSPARVEAAQPIATTEPAGLGTPRIQVQRTDSDIRRSSWLDEATRITISALQTAKDVSGTVKVLSHALPCPSATGFAFPTVINSLHNDTPGSNTYWVNVFHALHGRYNMSDLPTSPPGTPGPAVGGDDYFTTKVFDSAVPVLDYQDTAITLPKTPRPVVPPATINVSIVERYIPPTRESEFAEMFDLKGRSLLVDRLVEISPDNGTLLFIYPTKRGAQTFARQYLSPVLDPLLRSMCIINGLSVDLGSELGTMSAVDSLLSFDTLSRKIRQLCRDLSQEGNQLSRMTGRRCSFSLQYASKEEVVLDRKVWAENWWVKQEKPRVRDILSRYFRISRKMPVDSDVTPTNLIHEVLDGVASRPYASGDEPTHGVEVGVFVIKRSS